MIKFRAWHKEYLLMCRVITLCFDGFPVQLTRVNIMSNKGVINVLKAELQDIELMQHTSLQDKNDKDIYAGDIICCAYSHACGGTAEDFYQVEFKDGAFMAKFISNPKYNKDSDYTLLSELFDGSQLDAITVQGNIYEGSELLDKRLKYWEGL